jgi:alkanesulfonate monooxygenase SsuD/methylene tetrahydromethanopterin reductase-like flavin-dependent oxidoreductase (luciferase family)
LNGAWVDSRTLHDPDSTGMTAPSPARVGIALPAGPALLPGSLAEAARNIEEAGFASAWVFDTVGRGFLYQDPLIALAVAASATTRIELGTGILQLPLRNPVNLAREVLTAQLVCDGRLLLGVGAGSTPADFAAVGVDFDGRFRLFSRSLSTMRKLWAGETVGEASLGTPWARTHGGPPVLIGSWAGSRWVARAATEFDGWIASGARGSWRLLADGIERFRIFGGKRAVVTNILAGFQPEPSPDGPDDAVTLLGPPVVVAERLQRLFALGFDDVVLVPRDHDLPHLAEFRALI